MLLEKYLFDNRNNKVIRATLEQHRYRGVDNSIIYKVFTSDFCANLSSKCSNKLAPNVITIVGILTMVLCLIFGIFLLGGLVGESLGFAYWVVFTPSLVFYYICDNLDGK